MRRRNAVVAVAVIPILLLAAWAAYASQNGERGFSVSALLLAVLGSGALSAAAAAFFARRKTGAEADVADATAKLRSAEAIASLLDTVEKLKDRNDKGDVEIDRLRAELATVRAEMTAIRALASAALAANRIDDYEAAAEMFDVLPDGVGVVVTKAGGRFELVNSAFCRMLGYEKADLLGHGWRKHLHPDDEEKTTAEEAAAHVRNVWGFSNRWLTSSGDWIEVVWYCLRYKKAPWDPAGHTFAWALLKPSPSEAASHHFVSPSARLPIRATEQR